MLKLPPCTKKVAVEISLFLSKEKEVKRETTCQINSGLQSLLAEFLGATS